MKKLVADRTSLIDASGIRKVFALAGELKDLVNFSIGQPDFDVPEPLEHEAIQNNVLVIPGNVFREKDTHFRISFATSDEKIQQGVDILRRRR